MYRAAASLASMARQARSGARQIAGRLALQRNYAAKDINFGVEARALMLRGVEELADAVKVTMGPKVTVSKDDTVILDGAGEKAIEERAEQLISSIELSTSDYDKEKLHERLAKLSDGVSVLKVGGDTDTEVGEKKDRVTDALNATKAEGCVPGGGVPLLYASKDADKLRIANFDQKVGVQVIQNALKVRVPSGRRFFSSAATALEGTAMIRNTITCPLEGVPQVVALNYDFSMSHFRLSQCQTYASVDASSVLGYDKHVYVANWVQRSFYFCLTFGGRWIILLIDPSTGWFYGFINSNGIFQFSRNGLLPYVTLDAATILKYQGKYAEMASEGGKHIPISIEHLRDVVLTLADFDGVMTDKFDLALSVVIHTIMEPSKFHDAYSIVYNSFYEGTECTYDSVMPSINLLKKKWGRLGFLAGRYILRSLCDDQPPAVDDPTIAALGVDGITTVDDILDKIFLMPNSFVPRCYIQPGRKRDTRFWAPVDPGLGDPHIHPMDSPFAMMNDNPEAMRVLELFLGNRAGGAPCSQAIQLVRERPIGSDPSTVWRSVIPIRGRALYETENIVPKLYNVLKEQGATCWTEAGVAKV